MWKTLLSMVGKPDVLIVSGSLLAISAAGNELLGGPDPFVVAFGLLAAGCFGAAITLAAIRYERNEATRTPR